MVLPESPEMVQEVQAGSRQNQAELVVSSPPSLGAQGRPGFLHLGPAMGLVKEQEWEIVGSRNTRKKRRKSRV